MLPSWSDKKRTAACSKILPFPRISCISFSFFPSTLVIVNPELSQWTNENCDSFVRNKDYKHSELVFSAIPFLWKKKGAYNFHGSKKINLQTSTGSIASAASYTHFGQNWQMPNRQPTSVKQRDFGHQKAWQGRGHEKSHLAGHPGHESEKSNN